MTETKNLEGVRVGDEVFRLLTGERGKVQGIISPHLVELPLRVKWNDGKVADYTIDGRAWTNDVFPIVVFALPKVEYAPRPKKKSLEVVLVHYDGCLVVQPKKDIGLADWAKLYAKPPMTMTLEWEEVE